VKTGSPTFWLLLVYRTLLFITPYVLGWELSQLSAAELLAGQEPSNFTMDALERAQVILVVALMFVPAARQKHIIAISVSILMMEVLKESWQWSLPFELCLVAMYPINAKELYGMFVQLRGQQRLLGCREHGKAIELAPIPITKAERIIVPALALVLATGAVIVGIANVWKIGMALPDQRVPALLIEK
jgi:hypothetical protein